MVETDSSNATERRSWSAQAFAVTAAAAVYFGGRKVVEGGEARSLANADRLLSIERALHIDIERGLQQQTLSRQWLVDLANHTYVWLHWPFIVAALFITYRRAPDAFRTLRNAMIVSGVFGLAIFALVPVAPPRFVSGFVGTLSQAERQHYLRYPATWQNRFASLPSFHVGWTMLASLALASLVTSRAARVALHAAGPAVGVAVIVTANHYVIDVLAGVVISFAALWLVDGHRFRWVS